MVFTTCYMLLARYKCQFNSSCNTAITTGHGDKTVLPLKVNTQLLFKVCITMFQKMKEFSDSLHRWILHGDCKEKKKFVLTYTLIKKLLYMDLYQCIKPTYWQSIYKAMFATMYVPVHDEDANGKAKVKSVSGQVLYTTRVQCDSETAKYVDQEHNARSQVSKPRSWLDLELVC